MFCLSKTSNGKDWMIHLVLKQVEELSTSKVALVVTLHNAFGPWEVFKIQKCKSLDQEHLNHVVLSTFWHSFTV